MFMKKFLFYVLGGIVGAFMVQLIEGDTYSMNALVIYLTAGVIVGSACYRYYEHRTEN